MKWINPTLLIVICSLLGCQHTPPLFMAPKNPVHRKIWLSTQNKINNQNFNFDADISFGLNHLGRNLSGDGKLQSRFTTKSYLLQIKDTFGRSIFVLENSKFFHAFYPTQKMFYQTQKEGVSFFNNIASLGPLKLSEIVELTFGKIPHDWISKDSLIVEQTSVGCLERVWIQQSNQEMFLEWQNPRKQKCFQSLCWVYDGLLIKNFSNNASLKIELDSLHFISDPIQSEWTTNLKKDSKKIAL